MRINTVEFPRPVLNEYLNDIENGSFEISNLGYENTNDSIKLKMAYSLCCPGIEKLISDGYAKVILRATCSKTSYREIFDFINTSETDIEIQKTRVIDNLYLQGIIISTKEYDNYKLDEFNENYFGNYSFALRKGDVIANEEGIDIKLRTIFEDSIAGVVQIKPDSSIDVMKVRYATCDEDNHDNSDYIFIMLPKDDYQTYLNLRIKKHLKFGIERFLHSSLILPAITEAISLLKTEMEYDDEHVYRGTVWADSILSALTKKGIDDITSTYKTSVEMANMVLGDVASDALNDLFQKMNELSTMRRDDDLI